MIATAILLFSQIDPLPPPPEPGTKFQPAEAAPSTEPAPRGPPPPYRAGPSPGTRAAPEPYVADEHPDPVPMPRRGSQLALRSGAALPAGHLAGSSPMAALTATQIPLFMDIGAKISRYVFLGGYASVAFGGVTDRWERNGCRAKDCGSYSTHLGAQIQIHFGSFERANPWIGYGFGYEWLWTTGSPGRTYRGPEYGRFMAGLDFRLSREFGLGPFVDATLAQYTDTSTTAQRCFRGPTVTCEENAQETTSRSTRGSPSVFASSSSRDHARAFPRAKIMSRICSRTAVLRSSTKAAWNGEVPVNFSISSPIANGMKCTPMMLTIA